jgi:hypothetical protein
MDTNRRRIELLEVRARAAVEAKDEREAKRVVAIWNARRAKGRHLWFHLTIGAAVIAERPWLTFVCPACQVIGQVDLRTLDRHPAATVESLIPSLSCRRCVPNAPFVRLIRISHLPSYT